MLFPFSAHLKTGPKALSVYPLRSSSIALWSRFLYDMDSALRQLRAEKQQFPRIHLP